MGVDEEREVVRPVAKKSEPLRVADDDIEFVAMNDEIALAVGCGMNGLALDFDAAEGQAQELAGEFVMIPRDKHHARAAPDLAEELLHDVVVRLRPIPPGAQPPAIDDVANQVYRVRFDMAQHVENEIGLAAAGAKMQIREKQRTVAMGPVRFGHARLSP